MNIALLKMTGSDAVAVFLRAAEGMEPKIARAFIQAIETIRVRIPAEKIALLLERRDYTSLENAFSGHFTSTEWQPYGQAIQQAVIAGTKATSETQGIVNGAQEDFEIRVGLNPRLEQFALTMTSTRIREIDQTTRDTIRQVIQSGTTAGDDPFAIARRIRGSIGLTQRQEAAVNNYERMLRALDPAVLERKLRDRRSDPTVARAISNDKALTDALQRGKLRGAGLDAFEQEPPPVDYPLLKLEQVVSTPHIGGGVFDNVAPVARHVFGNITKYLRGETVSADDLVIAGKSLNEVA